ncbi:MAG: transglutaminase domain-containing protein [Lachnospiraceae bacterium]
MKNIILIITISFLFCGCNLTKDMDKDTVLQGNYLAVESELEFSSEEQLVSEVHVESEEQEEAQETVSEDGKIFSDQKKIDIMRMHQEYYAFSKLNIEEQNVYAELYFATVNYLDEIIVSTLNTELLDKVFQYVFMDHPEIFYTNGYTVTKYSVKDEIQELGYKASYIYSEEEKIEREKKISEQVNQILNNVPQGSSDYEKVKYVYETIILSTEYVLDAPDNQNICSIFLTKQSVCQGYAKATQYLLNRMGVSTIIVSGEVNGEGHAWNIVLVEGKYYHVDTTWGDAYFLFEDESYANNQNNSINYDYLCVTTSQILKTHKMDEIIEIPFCDALESNYYVKEGVYFESFDKEKIKEVFEASYEKGNDSVSFKCANTTVYQEITNYLLTQEHIFSYIKNSGGTISYLNSEIQLSITFWL